MWRVWMLVIGLILIELAAFYAYSSRTASLQAANLDQRIIHSLGPGGGGGGGRELCDSKFIQVDELSSDRVISETDTGVIHLTLSNKGSENCDTILSLSAPGFEIDPKDPTLVVVPPGVKSVTFVWLVLPQKLGRFALRMNMELNGQIKVENVIGMTVTNILGLTVSQAKILALISTFAGPSLTLPAIAGMVMQWSKRRKRASARRKTVQN